METKNKHSNPIFTIIFLLLTFWIYQFFDYIVNNRNNGIEVDYNTEIAGIVSYATNDRGTTSLRIKRPKELKYLLSPTINYDYKACDLIDFVQSGDSVYKPTSCDTLFIYRNSRRFYFIINEVINYKE